MNIGGLYQTKELYWFLYPSLETALGPAALDVLRQPDAHAEYWSKELDCTVSYIPPSMFVLLEQNNDFIKILTTNGELGWIILNRWCKDDIEEVKVE